MESTVKIMVKNVYVPAETAPFDVSGSLSVKELKLQIASEFPGNPAPSAQKLIFGGKICTDDETLDALLTQNQANHGDEAVVFHLLVTTHVPKSRPTTPVAAVNKALAPVTTAEAATSPIAQSEQAAATAPTSVAATRSFVDSPRPVTAPANPLNMPSVTLPARQAPVPPAASAAFPPPPGNHHELYAQHMLLQQQVAIMAQIQYLQQLKLHSEATRASSNAAHAPTGAAGAQPVPAPAHFGHHFAHAPHFAPYMGMGFHPAHGLHAPGAAVPGVGAQPTEPIAPAAPRRDGRFMQLIREIGPLLDIRLALKMAFMLFIIGQDTPLERILLLSFLSFVSYLHITGILTKIFEVVTRNRRPAQAAGAADANNNDDPQQANGQADPNRVNAALGGAASRFNQLARIVRISNDRGFVQDLKSFFVGLLLSLVPAWQPQPLDVNAAPAVNPGDVPIQGI